MTSGGGVATQSAEVEGPGMDGGGGAISRFRRAIRFRLVFCFSWGSWLCRLRSIDMGRD
uniref:Uncharacterized protein n=1 Tax=Arundo donax TaxID=35708 RepID=A0A0A8Y3T3_ARUDO